MRRLVALALVLPAVIVAAAAAAQTAQEQFNDYPTAARADYVFGCMAVNGQGRDILDKCSCSIDVIASILPYKDYVEAETVLAMRQTSGERMSMFRSPTVTEQYVAGLRRAQAEAEIRCF